MEALQLIQEGVKSAPRNSNFQMAMAHGPVATEIYICARIRDHPSCPEARHSMYGLQWFSIPWGLNPALRW